MKKFIAIALAAITLTAVSCGKDKDGRDIMTGNKGEKAVVTDKFSGVLPAADGPGIRYEIVLMHYEGRDGGIFHMRETYLEGENGRDISFDTYGRFMDVRGTKMSQSERILRLTPFEPNKPAVNFARNTGGSITMLDQQMGRIESRLNYTLEKVK